MLTTPLASLIRRTMSRRTTMLGVPGTHGARTPVLSHPWRPVVDPPLLPRTQASSARSASTWSATLSSSSRARSASLVRGQRPTRRAPKKYARPPRSLLTVTRPFWQVSLLLSCGVTAGAHARRRLLRLPTGSSTSTRTRSRRGDRIGAARGAVRWPPPGAHPREAPVAHASRPHPCATPTWGGPGE